MVSTCYVRSLGIILRAARVVLVKKRKTMWLVFLFRVVAWVVVARVVPYTSSDQCKNQHLSRFILLFIQTKNHGKYKSKNMTKTRKYKEKGRGKIVSV
jgi:hypothetical protein